MRAIAIASLTHRAIGALAELPRSPWGLSPTGASPLRGEACDETCELRSGPFEAEVCVVCTDDFQAGEFEAEVCAVCTNDF
ncbi:hypothetical protein T484DRAFT_1816704 [Baffinella frigidus]|nr:hypothetical protein T484DRAFT_1816704 [Cryptophyta sp. CCMP2293]